MELAFCLLDLLLMPCIFISRYMFFYTLHAAFIGINIRIFGTKTINFSYIHILLEVEMLLVILHKFTVSVTDQNTTNIHVACQNLTVDIF